MTIGEDQNKDGDQNKTAWWCLLVSFFVIAGW